MMKRFKMHLLLARLEERLVVAPFGTARYFITFGRIAKLMKAHKEVI